MMARPYQDDCFFAIEIRVPYPGTGMIGDALGDAYEHATDRSWLLNP